MHADHDVASAAFLGELDRWTTVLPALSDDELFAPSLCHGWARLDVATHVHLGLKEMFGGLVSPTEHPTTVDAASHWAADPPTSGTGVDPSDHLRFVRLLASAYRRPSSLVVQFGHTAAALARGVRGLRHGRLLSQGHVLSSGDFLATWAAELAVHHLDLDLAREFPGPTAASLTIARRTAEALAGGAMPARWDDADAVLRGWGRAGLDEEQRAEAGGLAARLPALG